MTKQRWVWPIGVGLGLLVATSCSSGDDDDGSDDATETGSDGTGGGQSSVFLTDSGTGVTPAQDTVDGLEAISSEQAEALEDPAQVCAGWSAEPEGGMPSGPWPAGQRMIVLR